MTIVKHPTHRLFNNSGEVIQDFESEARAKTAADQRSAQLQGARHYVRDIQSREIVYETSAKNVAEDK